MDKQFPIIYTTRLELDYLKHIGEHVEAFSRMDPIERRQHRIKQLSGYLAGVEKRVNWGDLDAAMIVEDAHTRLSKLLGIGKAKKVIIDKEITNVVNELSEV
jgi:hypothetical protein